MTRHSIKHSKQVFYTAVFLTAAMKRPLKASSNLVNVTTFFKNFSPYLRSTKVLALCPKQKLESNSGLHG